MSDSNKKKLKWQAGNALQPIKMSLDGLDIQMETGMLYYDNIIQSFEETIVQLANLDSVALEKAVADILAENPKNTIEKFFDLEIEELFNMPVQHRGSELKTLVVLSNLGSVESVETQLSTVMKQSFAVDQGTIISVSRDLGGELELIDIDPNFIPIIPADFNDFPTTPYILIGDSDEILLRSNPNVTIQTNIFQEGARFGTDSSDSLTINFTRAGSIKVTLGDRVVLTTPEGNTLTLYLGTVGGFVKGDIVYEMNNPVSHIAGPGVDVYVDGGTGEQVFVDKFTYTLVDGNFDSATNDIDIHVIDDVPVANDNTNNVDETALFVNGIGTETTVGNLLTDDDGSGVDTLGGDGGQVTLVNGITDGGAGDQDAVANGTVVANTTYGQIAVDTTTGAYTYTLVNATAVPDGNGSANDIISYQITDTDGDTATANLTITIDLNQAPTANDDAMATDEDNSTTYNTPGVLINDTDPDTGDKLRISSIDTTGTVGQVTFLANGQIVYNPNSLFESLAEGQITTDSFVYTLSDAEGLTDTATVTITITGINDAPIAVVDTDSGNEGNETVASVAITGNVLTNDTDVDSPQIDFTTMAQLTVGTYGTLTLNADGSYSYTIDDNNATVNALNVGGSVVDVFNYTMSDNNATNPKTSNSTLTITIDGTNDAPVAVADVNSGNEGNETVASVAMTGNVLTNDTDVDTALGNLDVTAAVIVGTYGTLTLNADGSYSYAIDDNNATVNALNTGSSVQDVLNYTLNDNHGTDPKSVTGTLTITIDGTNDAPVIADLDGDVFIHIDGGGAQTLNQGAAASVSDVDSSDFDTGTLRVEITNNAVLLEDVISVENQGAGAGQIGFDGTNVSYGATTIGVKDVGSTNILLIINLDSDADTTSVSALLNAITYENTNIVNPSILDRTVDFTVSDGDGSSSSVASVTVTDLDIDAGIGVEIDSEIDLGDVIDSEDTEIDLSGLSETKPEPEQNNGVSELANGLEDGLSNVFGFLGADIIDLFNPELTIFEI